MGFSCDGGDNGLAIGWVAATLHRGEAPIRTIVVTLIFIEDVALQRSRLFSRFSSLNSLRVCVVRPSLRQPSVQVRLFHPGSGSSAPKARTRAPEALVYVPPSGAPQAAPCTRADIAPFVLPAMAHLLGWPKWKATSFPHSSRSIAPEDQWAPILTPPGPMLQRALIRMHTSSITSGSDFESNHIVRVWSRSAASAINTSVP